MEKEIHRLRGCVETLEWYEERLRKNLKADGKSDHPQAVAFWWAFALGRTTLNAILLLAEQGHEYGLCAPILCRPFYELATRLLWAARAPNGWQRLVASWMAEDKKWGQRLVDEV